MELLLFISAGLALGLTIPVYRRRGAPGSGTFLWLLIAIAIWCLTGVAHWAAGALEQKIAWARVQYAGISSVPPLWMMFAFEYAGSTWTHRRRNVLLLWVIPVLTMIAALTNGWHQALWPSVTMTAAGLATYAHGWWFWIATAFNYSVVMLGTLSLVRALRRSPPPYRAQFLSLLSAALLPWAGNFAYIARVMPVDGLDPTPLLFTVSAGLFTYALFRSHLFDLVPVARDHLVESLSDAVVVIDASRRVLDMNAAALRLAAGDRSFLAQWLGRPIEELLPFLGGTPLAEGITQGSNFLTTLESSYYEVRITPVRAADDRLLGSAVLLRDVTEQRRAALERTALETRVQEQQKRESLSLLAGGLAHDFNNLLAGIVGNADLLALRMPPSSEMGSHLDAIILGAQRAADLVSKMLAYAGERHGASEQVDLDALISEMLDLLRASAARHCSLRYHGQPVEIFADPVQIRQVAMNLIINATEAVEEVSGCVEVAVGAECLSTWQLANMRFGDDAPPGTYAFLEVRDNGSGMDDTTLRRIFTPFFSTKPAGHGLGLAAVQGIVRGHRGAIRVESHVGAGTRVTVWFPLSQVSSRHTTSASPASPSLIS